MEETKDVSESLAPSDDNTAMKDEQRRVYKNILSISFSFMLTFMAFVSLQNLQSSLNVDEGIGVTSLSIIYGALIISSLFFAPLTIRLLGCKWTLVLCTFCYVGYAAANFYPTWYTMIPSSIILGFAGGPLWSAKCAYLTSSAIYYGKVKHQSTETLVTRFFGVFYMFFMTGSVVGNLVLSLVLQPSEQNDGNKTTTTALVCGASDCPIFAAASTNNTLLLKPPNRQSVFILMGIFLAAIVVAILPLTFIVQNIKVYSNKRKEKGMWAEVIAPIKQWKDLKMALLFPILTFSGSMMGFVNADFTKSYITCPFGINHVGFVMIAFATMQAVSSLLMDRVISLIGRKLLMFASAFVNIIILVVLLLWKPENSTLAVVYAIGGVSGIYCCVWVTALNSYIGILFPEDQEAAFSNLRVWQSFGFLLSFAYGNYLCAHVKIYILIALMILSILLYYIVQRIADKIVAEAVTSANEIGLLSPKEAAS